MEARNSSLLLGRLCWIAILSAAEAVQAQSVVIPMVGRPEIHGMAVAGAPMRMPMIANPNPALIRSAQPGGSPNFLVLSNDPELTRVVSATAEKLRKELAIHWLGEELPDWSRRCPIHVVTGPNLGAGGETRFTLYMGQVGNWDMTVQGSRERILDSVLPHEITHTIFASHFAPLNEHVPRWADEGACTTVEHSSEQNKHKTHLIEYLKTRRGLSFNRMFSLVDYPSDILPMYAQGHSVVEFLLAQGGPRKFVQFLEEGMRTHQWEAAVKRAYGYETLGILQTQWNLWIADGRGPVDAFAGMPKAGSASQVSAVAASAQGRASAGSAGRGFRNAQPVASVPSLDARVEAGELTDFPEGARIELSDQQVTLIASNASSGGASPNASSAPSNELYRPAMAGRPNDRSAAENSTSPSPVSVETPSGYFRQRLDQSRTSTNVSPFVFR